jgi:NADH:ubiquinone oxidoreductase subunit 6 (subunit J)
MVLMLFVIMLLNVAQPEPTDRRLGVIRPFGVIAAFILLAELVAVGVRYGAPPEQPQAAGATTASVTATPIPRPTIPPAATPIADYVGAADAGHTQQLAAVLFSRYLFPFEVTSILLLVAILGATILARKRPEYEDVAGVRVK